MVTVIVELDDRAALFKMIFYLLALVVVAYATEKPYHPINSPITPHSMSGRIINGEDAAEGEFPWQVSLQVRGSHFCGGSIITPTKIMSAAHCAVYQTEVTANAGSLEWRNPAQTADVQSFVQHPQYNDRTYDYDYGIVTLSAGLTWSNNVGPIDLADAGVEYAAGLTAITSGWGYVVRFPATIPDQMQRASIPLVSAEDCQAFWGSNIPITERIQCAAGNGGATSCMGDSGGPLVVPDALTASGYRLIGAVSWGSSTCSNTSPSGYAKISAGRSWIDSMM